MKYNFIDIVDRIKFGSAKWLWMQEKNPNIPKDIVPFSVADMEFEIAPNLENVLKNAKHLGYTRANDSYYEAIISWFKRRHKLTFKKEWIVTSQGIVFALHTAIKSYSNKGDNIIIMPPVYYPFFRAIQKTGRKILRNSLKFDGKKYTINFKDLENKAKKAKILILCNPHNPVGRVWNKDELDKVAKICNENSVVVISDEIHCDLVFNKFTSFSKVAKDTNFILCTAPSKSFNIAGIQASNIIIKDKKLRKLYKNELDNIGVHLLNALAYDMTKVAYNECEEWLDTALSVIKENKEMLFNFIKDEIPLIKVCDLEGTYLMWLDFRKLGFSAKKLEEFMTKKAFIFGDEGYIFGKEGEGFERINIACPKNVLKDALIRLKDALKDEKLL